MRRPDWDVDKARGAEAEALWRKTRTMLVVGAAEVKRDDLAAETGNLYVEHEAWTALGWKPSGIATTKATVWVVVCWPLAIVAPTHAVRLLHAAALRKGMRAECERGSHPTRGALVPVDKFVLWLVRWSRSPLVADSGMTAVARSELAECEA